MLELGRMLEQDFKMQTSKSTGQLDSAKSSAKKTKKNTMRETSKEKIESQASMERVQVSPTARRAHTHRAQKHRAQTHRWPRT